MLKMSVLLRSAYAGAVPCGCGMIGVGYSAVRSRGGVAVTVLCGHSHTVRAIANISGSHGFPKTPTKYSCETPLTSTMSITQSMRDIDRAVRDAVGTRDEYESDEDGRSPRRV